jgi:hypothetical protein
MQKEHKFIDRIKLTYHRNVRSPQRTVGYRSLTHASRLIRQKFLPLYKERITYISVNIRHVGFYIAAHFDMTDREELARLYGSIEVDLDGATQFSETDADLLPLLQLMTLAPKLQATLATVEFLNPGYAPQWLHDLCILLRLMKIHNIVMRAHILKSVQRMIFRFTSDLMPVPLLEVWLRVPHERVEFLKQIGCAGMKELRIAVDQDANL